MTNFAPHGTLELTIEDNLILLDVQGPWNLEYIDHLHEKLLWAVSQVDQSNYGVLLTPIGEAISVEEGFEYHLNFLRQGYCVKPRALYYSAVN